MNRTTALILVAVISIMATYFVMSMMGTKGALCDVHPQLSDGEIGTMRANIARARNQAFAMVTGEGKDKDAANKVADDAAFDTFVHDLRGALRTEFVRLQRALDGCF